MAARLCAGSWTYGLCRNSERSGASTKDCNSRAVRQPAESSEYSLFSPQTHNEPLNATGYRRTQDNGEG